MIFIHWILWLIILSYLILKKRNVDFYTVAILGFLFYTLPAFWGTTWSTQDLYFSEVHLETYAVIDLISILMFSSMIWFDYKYIRKGYLNNKVNYSAYPKALFYVLMVFSYLGMLLAINKAGLNVILSANKNMLDIELMNPYFSLSIWTSLITFAYSSYVNSRKLFISSILIMLFTLFLGIRSYFIIGVLSYALIYATKKKEVQLYKFWKTGAVLASVGLLATLYREIYTIFKRGDFSYLFSILTTKEFYFEKIFTLPHEIYIVFSTLNISVDSDLHLGGEFIWYQIINFLPLINKVISVPEVRYSRVILEQFYSGSRYGMASNIWAEMYSSGGLLFVILFTLIWLKLISIFNRLLLNKTRIGIFFIPFGIYFSFYINRLSFALAIGDSKYVLFITILSYSVYYFFMKPYIKNKQITNKNTGTMEGLNR